MMTSSNHLPPTALVMSGSLDACPAAGPNGQTELCRFPAAEGTAGGEVADGGEAAAPAALAVVGAVVQAVGVQAAVLSAAGHAVALDAGPTDDSRALCGQACGSYCKPVVALRGCAIVAPYRPS